jgi:RND family efflux transporter MFP subunit
MSEDNSEKNQPAVTPPANPRLNRLPAYLRRLDWRISAGILVVVVIALVWRGTVGHAKPGNLPEEALAVAVARVTRQDLARELTCEAELRPYQEIDLHAKVAGYLQKITVDIGDRVEAGQLLAVIEVPELGDDIQRANASLKRCQEEVARAQAAHDEAHLVYTRLTAIDKARPNLIAQQELDTAVEKDRATGSSLAAASAEVDVAKADINKLQTMLKYSRITAPFPGVITKRYADPGALIQAGTSSSTQTLPLVRLSQNDRLRLDIPVSVSYVSRVELGDPVQIQVASLERAFSGKIARSTRKIETATRTMEVEVDVPNTDLKLIPGMYASVILRLDHRDQALAVPVEAVSRKKTCTVFVVGNDQRMEERVVRLGLETPQQVEVTSGVKENELVMIGSRTQVHPGQRVEPKLIEAETIETAGTSE